MQRTFSFLMVNATISLRPFFVFPNKRNRSSICEWSVSLKALLCLSKNACSCSLTETLCFTQLFVLFPSSHSNVKISGKIMFSTYIRCSYILLFMFIFVKAAVIWHHICDNSFKLLSWEQIQRKSSEELIKVLRLPVLPQILVFTTQQSTVGWEGQKPLVGT